MFPILLDYKLLGMYVVCMYTRETRGVMIFHSSKIYCYVRVDLPCPTSSKIKK